MNLRRVSAAACLTIVLVAHSGCATSEKSEGEWCKAVKPGVVTTVNHYCVVVGDDPVDPSVKAITWKGQQVGLCCEGCRPRWNKMSEAEKDQAVARAVAKGKPE
ncbi:MAG: hypothetical protein IT438_16005 [Phycisphaerales bacterium]|nr:hypothetical protein [Phycisphaerales bacterium]